MILRVVALILEVSTAQHHGRRAVKGRELRTSCARHRRIWMNFTRADAARERLTVDIYVEILACGRNRGVSEGCIDRVGNANEDDGEVLNFDDTYDGLGHQLEESGDTFNDDTFGGDEPVTRDGVGRDFDFAGQTAKVRMPS